MALRWPTAHMAGDCASLRQAEGPGQGRKGTEGCWISHVLPFAVF